MYCQPMEVCMYMKICNPAWLSARYVPVEMFAPQMSIHANTQTLLQPKLYSIQQCHSQTVLVPAHKRPARSMHRLKVIGSASSNDDASARQGNGKSSGQDPKSSKADFSAYWSLKVREIFNPRRRYLEQAERRRVVEEPEFARRLGEQLQQQRRVIDAMDQVDREVQQIESQGATTVDMHALLAAAQPVSQDVSIRPPSVAGSLRVSWWGARSMLQAAVMLPFTTIAAAVKGWHSIFNSSRYENFLMAEGERIWYWRNRTEKERWFWNVCFWERLLLPILCYIGYERVVPNNLLWAVIIPATFFAWRTGTLPGPLSLDFWLIAYLGFYRKCWGSMMWLLTAIFQ